VCEEVYKDGGGCGFRMRVVSHMYVNQRLVWRWTQEASTPVEMRKKVRQWGIGHVLYNAVSATYRTTLWYAGRPWSDRQLALYEEFIRRYWTLEYRSPLADNDNGGYYVWRIESRPQAPAPAVWYLPGAEGILSPLNAPWVGRDGVPSTAQYLQWLQEVAARTPNVCNGLDAYSYALERAGNWTAALPLLERLHRAGFEGNALLARYGQALLIAGRVDAALPVVARACRHSSDKGIRRLLATALLQSAFASLQH
ncbi:MAG: hypothetical protein AAB368_16715, partial [bacterium]